MRLVLLALALIALPVHAQTFKCTVAGKVTYQATPCAIGEQRPVDATPNSGVTGLKQDADRMAVKEHADEQRAARAPKPKPQPAKRDRQWYRDNCTERRSSRGTLAGYDC